MGKVAPQHLLDLMQEMELTLTSTSLIHKTLWLETCRGQDGLMGFSEDMSSGSMKKLFLACVLEILVSLLNIHRIELEQYAH